MDNINSNDRLDGLREDLDNNYQVSIDEVKLLELMNLTRQENTM